MHFTIFIRRLGFGLLLVTTLGVGWLLHGVLLAPTNTSAERSQAVNAPRTAGTVPISSQLGTSTSTYPVPDRALNSINSNQFKLTAGLHPGRGQSIPAAADMHELPVTDVTFYNWRGELLSGWLALITPQAPVIILTHGTPGNRLSMLHRAAFLYKHGYNVLLFDFQSYGRSQGVTSTLGMVESEDILAAISFLHGLPDTMYSKIGVLGLSMGATAAVLAASRSSDILALVAESCPVDATRVLADVPDEASREADQQLVEEVYGVDITQARPIDAVNKLAGRSAIFFINGDADDITPLPGMQALYQAAGAPKQYWIVPNAGHAQSFAVDPGEYMQRVDAFFDTYLRQA
jgi:dipeptidyl aminopeptidase/acylaminoacyl peptidase